MIKLFVLFLVVVYQFIAIPSHASTVINSLPFVCNIDNETYELSDDLSLASGTAIIIAADNVTLDGSNKSLTCGITDSGTGILTGNVSDFEVYDLTIVQGVRGGPGFDSSWYDPNNLSIHDCTFILEQSGGQAIILRDVNQYIDIEIASNTIKMNHNTSGSCKAIQIEHAGYIGGNIHNNIITASERIDTNNRNSLISVVGRSDEKSLNIYNNTLNMNCGEYGEGIRLYSTKNNNIYSNTVNINTTYARGLLLDGVKSVQVTSNTININSINGGTGNTAGVRLRGSHSCSISTNLFNDSNAEDSWRGYPIIFGGAVDNQTILSANTFASNTMIYKKGYAVNEYTGGAVDTVFTENKYIASNNTLGIYFLRPSSLYTKGGKLF